jgi:very-short-patch-repair endonuclease
MKTDAKEMSVTHLKSVSKIFLEKNNISEHKMGRFSLDIYFPESKIAFEYDGPDHYDKVANHERDIRKDQLCLDQGIRLVRWPYYFQLTRDVAQYLFGEHYTDQKFQKAIKIVYGASEESEILAPGLHGSKFTPANFTSLGIKRFIRDIENAPISLRSQVIHSFRLYEKMIEVKYGKEFLWLLYPLDNASFDEFMDYAPDPSHLNYLFKNKKYLSQS